MLYDGHCTYRFRWANQQSVPFPPLVLQVRFRCCMKIVVVDRAPSECVQVVFFAVFIMFVTAWVDPDIRLMIKARRSDDGENATYVARLYCTETSVCVTFRWNDWGTSFSRVDNPVCALIGRLFLRSMGGQSSASCDSFVSCTAVSPFILHVRTC